MDDKPAQDQNPAPVLPQSGPTTNPPVEAPPSPAPMEPPLSSPATVDQPDQSAPVPFGAGQAEQTPPLISETPAVLSDTPLPPAMEQTPIPPAPPTPAPAPAGSPRFGEAGGPPSSGEVSLEFPNEPAESGGGKKFWLIIPIVIVILILAAFFLLRGRGEESITQEEQPIPTVQPSITAAAPLLLSLTSPKEGEIATSAAIDITGSTSPKAAVVFFTDKNWESTDSAATGLFAGKIKLTSGTNDILVVAVNNKGEKKSQARKVIFGIAGSSPSASLAEATGSGLTRGKIQAIAGIITGINGQIVTILDKSQGETFYNLKVASASSALSLGQAALAIATLDQEGNLTADLLHAVAK
ncbi:hypothetical protein HYT17_00010 [Candidatus Microgenomates bacterium]|nr:hypothetical protein [Candidatus Microgenomates bacterium]